MSRLLGNKAEKKARLFLEKQGLQYLESNYRCRLGEIDLIMKDNFLVVFIEVRMRASDKFGDALQSITRTKQQKIMKTALHFMTKHGYALAHTYTRFDVIGIEELEKPPLWIQNAFGE